jgi:hypothetical protein
MLTWLRSEAHLPLLLERMAAANAHTQTIWKMSRPQADPVGTISTVFIAARVSPPFRKRLHLILKVTTDPVKDLFISALLHPDS